jgi:hypothetical protein
MKPIAILAVLMTVGAVFFAANGPAWFGLSLEGKLPETIDVPNATFFGNEKSNPFFD